MRKVFLQIHLWLGLSVGLLLALAGLTGSILVFDEEIDALLNPELLVVEAGESRVPFQQVVSTVEAAYPDQPISYVRMPRGAGETFEVTTAGTPALEIFVDPHSGSILGDRGVEQGFTNKLWHLHVHLLSGENGERVMGIVGLLTLLIVLSGVVVWWPRMRRWLEAFLVRWRAGWKRVNFDAHRAAGIWSAAFLALTASTGAALIFHDAFLAVANAVTASAPTPAPPVVVPRAGTDRVPIDAMLAEAHRALPGGTITYVSFPAAADQPLSVRLHFDEALHPNGRSFVYLDPWTGDALAVESALLAPAGLRALNLLYPLHIGSFGGLVVRVLYALFGLAPLFLLTTGAIMWWNRTIAPKRKRRRRGSAQTVPVRAVTPS